MAEPRKRWTLDEWTDFGRRCQALRRRLSGLTARLPGIDGIGAADIYTALQAEHRLQDALIAAEQPLLHGPEGDHHGPGPGPKPTKKWRLTRQEWADLGREFGAALGSMDRVQCRLDDLACEQHPDWADAHRCFYGGTPTV